MQVRFRSLIFFCLAMCVCYGIIICGTASVALAKPAPTPSAATPVPTLSPAPTPSASPSPTGTASPAPAGPLPAPAFSPSGEIPSNQPRITAITVEGNTLVPTESVLGVVSSRVGEPLLEPKLRRDLQAIFDMGTFTDVNVETPAYQGGVRVVFRVLENPVVKSIIVQGNTVVPTDKIRSLMETQEGKILNSKTLYNDVDAINKYYSETLGLVVQPSHVTDLNWSKDGVLSLQIQDGTAVTAVKIVGNTVFPEQELMRLVKSKPGDLFNQKTLKGDYDGIAKYYEDNDYILDTIRGDIDAEGVVTIRLTEAVVEAIKVEGNTKTKDAVILRNVRTKVGQVLRKKKIQRDLERLNNLGYFEKVDVVPEPGSTPGAVVLVWKVKEQKTGLATLGLGYTGGGSGAVRNGLTGSVSLSERNWKGKGQSASFAWQRGVNIDSISASFFDPSVNKRQDSLGLSFYTSSINALQQPVPNTNPLQYAFYNNKTTGGSVTIGHPLNDDLRIFFTLKRDVISNSQTANTLFVPIGLGSGSINGVAVGANYDTRDDVFNPHEGGYVNASVFNAGGILRGGFNYQKYTFEGRKYFPLRNRKTFALRLWGGAVTGGAPITELFYAGGSDSLRGFQDNQFIGSRLLVLNAEYRFPIAKIAMLNGAVFADAGNAWFPGGPSFLRKDAGVGLRLVLPTLGLGVIRIDYAVSGGGGSRTSIGIGQSF